MGGGVRRHHYFDNRKDLGKRMHRNILEGVGTL